MFERVLYLDFVAFDSVESWPFSFPTPETN